MRKINLLVILISSVAFIGCGDDDKPSTNNATNNPTNNGTNNPNNPTNNGTNNETNNETNNVDTVMFSGATVDFASQMAVEGLELCVVGMPEWPCGTSDADGNFGFPVPANMNIAVEATHATYATAQFLFVSEGDFTATNLVVIPSAAVDGILAGSGLTQDEAKGLVVIGLASAGVTPRVEPASGDEAVYLSGFTFAPSATGSPEPGFSAILNVDPGEYTFHMDHDVETCTFQGWDVNGTRNGILIRAGVMTSLFSSTCVD